MTKHQTQPYVSTIHRNETESTEIAEDTARCRKDGKISEI